MKTKASAVLLLALFLSLPYAHADEAGICKSVCTSDKQQCRRDADDQTRYDTDPLIGHVLKIKDKAPVETTPDASAKRKSEHNRRMERYHACDSQYMQCVSACKE